MDNIFKKAQQLSKAFMLPIAVLPMAGLLLGIGGSLSNPNTLVAYPILNNAFLQAVFKVMSASGTIVFANLPLLFSIGLAIGLVKKDKATAGFSSVLAYLIINATINVFLQINNSLADQTSALSQGQGIILGIQTLETGVFGGILTGIMVSYIHSKTYKTQLPDYLGFFSGSRFVPIVTALFSILLGIILYYVWPFFQSLIYVFGSIVEQSGYIGTFVYGFALRMLGPLGLHHIFYLPFWQTAIGGTLEVNGKIIQGTQNIFFAQLSDPNTASFFEGTSRFMSGRFLTMMFGLIGASLAIYKCSRSENKKVVGGLMISAALTSFLTGITEPIEFTFLFVSPFLYIIHALFDGLAFMLSHILNITIGQTFSGGFIDFILFGVLQGNEKTNWLLTILFGIPWFFLYYLTFTFLINKFNILTPGREIENKNISENKGINANAVTIINSLGGKYNIEELDCCATRLRVSLKNINLFKKEELNKTNPINTLVKGSNVQIIYGPKVTLIKNEIEEILYEKE